MKPDGTPYTTKVNSAIPTDVITDLFTLQYENGLSLQDATDHNHGSLVPCGYTPWPLKHDSPEIVVKYNLGEVKLETVQL